MDYKQKALDHVRSVCPELYSLSTPLGKGIVSRMAQIHTPHLEHWLRGIASIKEENKPTNGFVVTENGEFGDHDFIFGSGQWSRDESAFTDYNLTKDGENQSEEFYKAYCEIVGV